MSESANTIVCETEGDVTVVRFTGGELREDEYSRQASDDLRKLAFGVGGKIVLSLRNVGYVSSSGVAALVLFNRLLHAVRGQLRVCDVSPLVSKAFIAAGLDKVLDIHGTKADALSAFKPKA